MLTVQIIAELHERLARALALIDVQNAALAAQDVEAFDAPTGLLLLLTKQERELLGVLHRIYPRAASLGALLDALPARDHAKDRNEKMVSVLVCRIRDALGIEAVETVRGIGFKLGSELHRALTGKGSD